MPKQKPKPPAPVTAARAVAAADEEIVAETKALIRSANRKAAEILRRGSPEQKERVMRMIFGQTVKEVLSPKAKSRDDEAEHLAELTADFHRTRAEMSPLEDSDAPVE